MTPGSTGLSSSGPKGMIVRLTKRVVVPTDISQVNSHCWLLMFSKYRAIRCQENENCRGHSWSTETHLGISTHRDEPLFPLGYQGMCHITFAFPQFTVYKARAPLSFTYEKNTESAQKNIHVHTKNQNWRKKRQLVAPELPIFF